ncbi:MAG TPA: hypothetical protein DEP07_20740 [Brevibacillus sp.]|nr:hypothetical protein EDM60_23145 [Brevibacillus parabrevis]HBZ82786.1 hypothetical protein [Brevibacillus sp.]
MLDFGSDYLSFIYPFFPLFYFLFVVYVALKILTYMKKKEQVSREINEQLKEILLLLKSRNNS